MARDLSSHSFHLFKTIVCPLSTTELSPPPLSYSPTIEIVKNSIGPTREIVKIALEVTIL